MTKDDRVMCSICAWRGKCAKKFSITASELLHCIDFSRDVTIRDRTKDEIKKLKEVKAKEAPKDDIIEYLPDEEAAVDEETEDEEVKEDERYLEDDEYIIEEDETTDEEE